MKTRHLSWMGAALLTVFLVAAPSSGQKNDQAELALKTAMKTETVDGNLKGAIEQYKKIAALPGAGRATLATALLWMGQCHEKLGEADTREARDAYELLVANTPTSPNKSRPRGPGWPHWPGLQAGRPARR